ncbi:UNVERIFIED_CONTAM: Wee1 [Trichonephila clavipes]
MRTYSSNNEVLTPMKVKLSYRARLLRRRSKSMRWTSLNESTDKLSYNEFENEFQPSKRMHLRDRDKNLSRYENEFHEICEIGSGMFGSVYQCVNRLDGCVYAIKKSRKPLKGTSDEWTSLRLCCLLSAAHIWMSYYGIAVLSFVVNSLKLCCCCTPPLVSCARPGPLHRTLSESPTLAREHLLSPAW